MWRRRPPEVAAAACSSFRRRPPAVSYTHLPCFRAGKYKAKNVWGGRDRCSAPQAARRAAMASPETPDCVPAMVEALQSEQRPVARRTFWVGVAAADGGERQIGHSGRPSRSPSHSDLAAVSFVASVSGWASFPGPAVRGSQQACAKEDDSNDPHFAVCPPLCYDQQCLLTLHTCQKCYRMRYRRPTEVIRRWQGKKARRGKAAG